MADGALPLTTFLLRGALALCLAVCGGRAQAQNTAIVGAKVYPAPYAAPIHNAVVLIHDRKILAVGPAAKTPIPAGYTVLSASGEVLTAGFWNNHVHLIAEGLLQPSTLSDTAMTAVLQKMFTRWGFTTVFDLASTMASANAIRGRIASGAVVGPTILTVGEPFYPPDGTPVYARPIYRADHLPSAEITSTPAAVSRVAEQAAEGANGVKLFTGAIVGGEVGVLHMSAPDVRAITGEAHRLGLPTFAHPTDAEGAEVAIDNGVDILAHTEALAGPWSAQFVAKLRARNIGLIPTLMLFEVDPDPRTPVETSIQQLRAQSEAGGDVLFGTDAGFMPVYDPTEEYRLMGRAMDWKGILASLTTTPARRFGYSRTKGKVQSGYDADLVLLRSDPAMDVASFASVQSVIRNGVVIYQTAKPLPPP